MTGLLIFLITTSYFHLLTPEVNHVVKCVIIKLIQIYIFKNLQYM